MTSEDESKRRAEIIMETTHIITKRMQEQGISVEIIIKVWLNSSKDIMERMGKQGMPQENIRKTIEDLEPDLSRI